jgi:hypothetical protein
MRTYSIRFNDGCDSDAAVVVQPDMSHAFKRARELALRDRGRRRLAAASDDDVRLEEAFPAG